MKIYTLILFATLFTMKSFAQPVKNFKKELSKLYDLNDSLLHIWRDDKNGCMKKRVMIIDSLITNNKFIIGMPSKVFLILFGKPDRLRGEGLFAYTVNNICDPKMKPILEGRQLDIIIRIEDEKIVSYDEVFIE